MLATKTGPIEGRENELEKEVLAFTEKLIILVSGRGGPFQTIENLQRGLVLHL